MRVTMWWRILGFWLLVCGVYAGDLASFINLGFSADQQFFLFGEYGVNPSKQQPYAFLYLLSVKDGSLQEEGAIEEFYDIAPLGGDAALLSLIQTLNHQTVRSLIQNYSIDHLRQGRVIYLKLTSLETDHQLSVVDYHTQQVFEITWELLPHPEEKGGYRGLEGHFRLLSSKGKVLKEEALFHQNSHNKARNYSVEQLIISESNTLLLVIEEEIQESTGYSVRYLVKPINLIP